MIFEIWIITLFFSWLYFPTEFWW